MSQVVQVKKVIETQTFIKFSEVAWRLLCIDLPEKARGWLSHAVFSIHCINVLLYGVFCITCVFRTPFDIDKTALGFSVLGTMLMIAVKYSCIHWNAARLEIILKLLPASYAARDVDTFAIDARLRGMQKFIRGYFFYMCTSFVFFILQPIGVYLETGAKTFAFQLEFPFDATAPLVYPVALLWHLLAHTTHIIAIVSNDNLVYGLVNVTALEFEILRRGFDDLRGSGVDFQTKLAALIRRQNELHEVTERLQQVLSPSFFFNFVTISFIMCFNAFQASTASSILEMIFGLLFCLSSTNQIILQCYFGEMLKNASENVVTGIYDCGWEELEDVRLKKLLVLAIQRAQKLATLSILNIADITMHQFETILSRTYSYFSVCRRLYAEM